MRVIVQPRQSIGQRGIAVPAMLGTISILHLAAIWRIGRGLQKILHAIDGVVQEVGVGAADVDVDLARELRTQRCPVAFENRFEIVVLAPVLGDVVIDLARLLVEDGLRIAVLAHRAIHRLPDIELLARPSVIAKCQLVPVDLVRW